MQIPTSLRALSLAVLLLPAAWAGASLLQGSPAVEPAPEHALLKRMAGTWDAKATLLGSKFEGTYEVTNTMNGLWNVVDYQMNLGVEVFHGHGMDGYDPEKDRYVSVWADSWNPGLQLYEGTYDAEKDELTLVGTGKDPMTGEVVPETHRVTFRGADAMTFEMLIGADGEQRKVMTIEYARRG